MAQLSQNIITAGERGNGMAQIFKVTKQQYDALIKGDGISFGGSLYTFDPESVYDVVDYSGPVYTLDRKGSSLHLNADDSPISVVDLTKVESASYADTSGGSFALISETLSRDAKPVCVAQWSEENLLLAWRGDDDVTGFRLSQDNGKLRLNGLPGTLDFPEVGEDTTDKIALDSEVVHKTGTETIGGVKTFSNGISVNSISDLNGTQRLTMGSTILVSATPVPSSNNTRDLGNENYKWKDLYLAGNLCDGTNSISVAELARKSDFSGTNDGTNWTSLTINGTTKNIPAGGSGEPDAYIKSASTSGNTLTLTKKDNSLVTFTPSFSNSYHTTGSWSGLTYTATNNGGAGSLVITLPTGTTSTTVAVGNHTHTKSQITDFPTIPTVNDGTLTIQKNGSTVGTFTANQSGNVTANITVPTKTSELTNDAGFLKVESDTLGTVMNRGADATQDLNFNNKDWYNAGTKVTTYSYSTSQTPNTQWYWFKILPPRSNECDVYYLVAEGDVNYAYNRGIYVLTVSNYSNGTSYNISLNCLGTNLPAVTNHFMYCAVDAVGNTYIQVGATWTSFLRFIHVKGTTSQTYESVGKAALGTIDGFNSIKVISDTGTIKITNGVASDNGITTVIAHDFIEDGTALSNKYLGKTAKASDSDKLDGNDSTYFQQKLVSGTNIKTINGTSILGSGDITAVGPAGPQGPAGPAGSVASITTTGSGNAITSIVLNSDKTVTATKEYTFLTSHQGIKTFNGSTALTGSGNAFYAPTAAGTSGQYLKSNGSGAPTWATFPTIPTDSNLVHKTGTENIAGNKSFVDWVGFISYIKINDDEDTYSGTDNFNDDIDTYYFSKGITAENANSGVTYNYSFPASSGTIATQEWVNGSSSNVVHKTGNEIIAGNKTFNGDVYVINSMHSDSYIYCSEGNAITYDGDINLTEYDNEPMAMVFDNANKCIKFIFNN